MEDKKSLGRKSTWATNLLCMQSFYFEKNPMTNACTALVYHANGCAGLNFSCEKYKIFYNIFKLLEAKITLRKAVQIQKLLSLNIFATVFAHRSSITVKRVEGMATECYTV